MSYAEWLQSEATKAESWGEHGRAERLRTIAAHVERLKEPHTSYQPALGTYQDGWAHGYSEAMNLALDLFDTPEGEPPPPPDAGVTREDVVFAGALAGAIARGHSTERAISIARGCTSRLRRQEEGS